MLTKIEKNHIKNMISSSTNAEKGALLSRKNSLLAGLGVLSSKRPLLYNEELEAITAIEIIAQIETILSKKGVFFLLRKKAYLSKKYFNNYIPFKKIF